MNKDFGKKKPRTFEHVIVQMMSYLADSSMINP